MKTLTSFLPRVLPYAMGCPEPLALQALVDSAIAFCEESQVLTQYADPVVTEAGVREYTIDVPPEQRVTRVRRVFCNGVELQTMAMLDAPLESSETSMPTAFTTSRLDSEFLLQLYPTPDAAYTLYVELALCPTRAATSVQDDLLDLWVEPVVAGALYRIFSVDGQPFSDPSKAMLQMSAALSLARKARIEGEFARTRSTRRVAPKAFI